MNTNTYQELWDSFGLRPEFSSAAQKEADKIKKNSFRYAYQHIPYEVLGVLHALECDSNFDRQLFNGQKWSEVTTIIPKGVGPFTSFEHALIAYCELMIKENKFPSAWTVEGTLAFLERHNGMGYRKRGINSPYLWSGSNHYDKGLYVADGKFDQNKKSAQVGACVLLKLLNWRPV